MAYWASHARCWYSVLGCSAPRYRCAHTPWHVCVMASLRKLVPDIALAATSSFHHLAIRGNGL
eukprot:2314602-Rhodomonas_salina.2